MRDKLQNEEYFKKYLGYQNERIDKFELLIKQVIEEKGVDFKGVKTGNLSLLNFYFDKINALYSSGASIEEIKILFPKVVKLFNNVWNKDDSYSNLLKVVTLTLLLNVSKNDVKELLNLIKKEEFSDYLIDFLLHSIDNNWKRSSQEFLFPKPYKYLKSIIESKDNETAILLLKNYLQKEWYRGHIDTGWYDSHKSNNEIFSGYWSYEAGAIAKILKLNDEELKDVAYYPYDIVHFND